MKGLSQGIAERGPFFIQCDTFQAKVTYERLRKRLSYFGAWEASSWSDAERLRNSPSLLSWNVTLNYDCTEHSQDMATRGYFSHTSPEGYDLSDRYMQGGFVMTLACAENIFQCSLVKQTWYLNRVPTYSEYYTQEEIASLAVRGRM